MYWGNAEVLNIVTTKLRKEVASLTNLQPMVARIGKWYILRCAFFFSKLRIFLTLTLFCLRTFILEIIMCMFTFPCLVGTPHLMYLMQLWLIAKKFSVFSKKKIKKRNKNCSKFLTLCTQCPITESLSSFRIACESQQQHLE